MKIILFLIFLMFFLSTSSFAILKRPFLALHFALNSVSFFDALRILDVAAVNNYNVLVVGVRDAVVHPSYNGITSELRWSSDELLEFVQAARDRNIEASQ